MLSDEVELKLELRPQDADRLEGSALLASEPQKNSQHSIYFDTPDHALAKAGLSLRIRRTGTKRIQTVKANGACSAGLFVRPEWEFSVPDDTPVIDLRTPIQTSLGDAVASVGAMFALCIERRTWEIHEGDAVLELVIDRGEVLAGNRRLPICELELELKQGNSEALFAMARKLDSIVPVRLGVLSKAERGYELRGAITTAFKPARVALKRDMTVQQAFQQIVFNCLRQYRRNESLLLEGETTEALHQARVALRRLRSALAAFKDIQFYDTGRRLHKEVRWLAREFGEARNLDVLLERSRPGMLHDQIAQAQQAAYARISKILVMPRARTLMLDLTQWSMIGAWLDDATIRELRDEPVRTFAKETLNRLRRKLKKADQDIWGADDAARHQVRKRAKRLRYAAEFFTALYDRKQQHVRYRHFVNALECLQDQLGQINDLSARPAVLAKFGLIDDPETTALLEHESKRALIHAAQHAYTDFIDVKPFWR